MPDKKIITINRETYQFLKDLMTRIAEQDNLSTANPYFYVIRQPRWRVVPEGYGSGEVKHVFFSPEEQREYTSKEEYIQSCIEDGISAKEAHMKAEEDLREGWLEQYFDEDNVFLTKDGYEKHLRLNRHNLHEPEYYIKHAWRNPEMDGLFKALCEITEVDVEAEQKRKWDEWQARRKAEKLQDANNGEHGGLPGM